MREVLEVKYYCPCREIETLETPEFLDDWSCFHYLEFLYFCEQCATIRCPMCIDKDPVAWYCPSCLFEVTSSIAANGSNACPRGCLRCPLCTANVVPHIQEGADGYELRCARCDWHSAGFSKGQSLVSQVLAKQNVNSSVEKLRAPFVAGEGTLGRFKASEKLYASPELPHVTPLRAKFVKHCRACRNILVRPDQRCGTSIYKTRSMAAETVPRVEAFGTTDRPGHVTFTIFNPTPVPVHVGLALQRSVEGVTLVTPAATLGAAAIKYDERTLIRQVPELYIGRETTTSRQVFMEGTRKKDGFSYGSNWACFDVEVNKDVQEIMVLATFRFEGGEENPEVGLWFKVSLLAH